MPRLLRISVFIYTSFLVWMMIVEICYAEVKPGRIAGKLETDLDGDGRPEVIVLRRAVPPVTFERVEIFRNQESNMPVFASEWRELCEMESNLMSAIGRVELKKIGDRVLVKYIWTEKGMGTGGGHESECITYYGYVTGKFGPVLEYTAKNLDWSKGRFGDSPYSREKISTLCIEDVDGDKESEIYILIREKTEEPEKIGEKFSPLRTNTVQRLFRYKWKESKGFVLTEGKKIGE